MLDALSLKNTKLGLETLELMGCEPGMIRSSSTALSRRSGSPTTRSSRVLGRAPDVLVPSDREIPRAVNEGVAITISRPSSEAAVAFRQLAGYYHNTNGAVHDSPEHREEDRGRRRLFGRKS